AARTIRFGAEDDVGRTVRIRIAETQGIRRLPTTQILDLVHRVGQGETEIQPPVPLFERTGIHGQLVPVVVHLPKVCALAAREAARRRQRQTYERVLDLLREIGELGGDPVLKECRVEADLELGTDLRTEIRVAQRSGRNGGDSA